MLDFWGIWCGPCKKEMPEIEKIWQEYKGKGLVVIGVHTSGTSFEDIKKFIEEKKYTFPIALDDKGQTIDAYGIKAFPQQVLIDKGIVRHSVCVEELLEEKVEK